MKITKFNSTHCFWHGFMAESFCCLAGIVIQNHKHYIMIWWLVCFLSGQPIDIEYFFLLDKHLAVEHDFAIYINIWLVVWSNLENSTSSMFWINCLVVCRVLGILLCAKTKLAKTRLAAYFADGTSVIEANRLGATPYFSCINLHIHKCLKSWWNENTLSTNRW